jgi:TRAP-type C4-dicarboxylate transport system substrate-binding protein
MPWKTVLVALKAHQAWKRIPPAQRKAILRAAQSSAKKHTPTVARTVRDRGPVVAKRLTEAIRESRKKR